MTAPHVDPESWDSVLFTDAKGAQVRLPPRKGIGIAVVNVDSEQKTDVKKKSGKSGATVTRQGAEPLPVEIVFTFPGWALDEITPLIDAIDPLGVSKGGPFGIGCSNLPPTLDTILVQKLGPRGTAMVSLGMGKVTIKGVQTTFDRGAAGKGGKGKAGPGDQYTQRLTPSDAAILEAEIAVLRAQNDSLAVQELNIVDDDEQYSAVEEQLNRNSKRIADLQRKLAQGLQFDPAAYEQSETNTPDKPGVTGGGGTQQGKISDLDAASYDPAKNPDAPKPGP